MDTIFLKPPISLWKTQSWTSKILSNFITQICSLTNFPKCGFRFTCPRNVRPLIYVSWLRTWGRSNTNQNCRRIADHSKIVVMHLSELHIYPDISRVLIPLLDNLPNHINNCEFWHYKSCNCPRLNLAPYKKA